MQVENSNPKLSVSLITYNQQGFITQAIESVLMQQTDFNFEIVLGDDCSTDGTREICIEYAKKYPELIQLRLPDRNLGFIRNMRENLMACKGEYIAILEGDDYWIDTKKLQKQVDFLEKHLECGLVCTDFEVINTETGEKGSSAEFYKTKALKENFAYNFIDLLEHNFVGSPTAVFRNSGIDYKEILPNHYQTGDYPIWLHLALKCKFYYLSEISAVYRYIQGSLSHSEDKYKALQFGVNIEEIRYRFAKLAGVEQLLISEYPKLLKYQLKIAFQHNDKEFYYNAFNKLSIEFPEFIHFSERLRKMIVGKIFLSNLFRLIKK